MRDDVNFSVLKGLILTDVKVGKDNETMTFTVNDGRQFEAYHQQDCCEGVYIEDICGDLEDLLNTPILIAEEVTNSDDTFGHESLDSFTWTFYKLATVKGYVTIRWLGESNGYYSESVDFCQI